MFPALKLQKTAMPHAVGATPVWTQYTYDGIGRTVSVLAPDGSSTTTYLYQGNTVKVTDPAGKWKKFTMDAFGNLTTVVEPDPANPTSSTYTTSYTYDAWGNLAGVSMPRGSTTQTRTFTYSGSLLQTATNPENGTVSYYYNSMNKVSRKHDAKGQDIVYTYDSIGRLTETQSYPLRHRQRRGRLSAGQLLLRHQSVRFDVLGSVHFRHGLYQRAIDCRAVLRRIERVLQFERARSQLRYHLSGDVQLHPGGR